MEQRNKISVVFPVPYEAEIMGTHDFGLVFLCFLTDCGNKDLSPAMSALILYHQPGPQIGKSRVAQPVTNKEPFGMKTLTQNTKVSQKGFHLA